MTELYQPPPPMVRPTPNMTDSLGWESTMWNTINKAVHDETQRTKVGARSIPQNVSLGNVSTVPSDISVKDKNGLGIGINEGGQTPLIEISVKFVLTMTQVQQEKTTQTARTLATKAANLLSQLEESSSLYPGFP